MKQLHVRQTMQYDPEADHYRRTEYVVKKVTNATAPLIDTILTPEQLDTYCKGED